MSDERIWSVVVARMGSERLRGKSMAELAGQPAFAHIVERLRRSRHLDGIVLATTMNPEDDLLRDCAARMGVPCFRGSAEDVLGRTLNAARSVRADIIVDITGDCPLVDPTIVDRVIEAFLADRPDYASIADALGMPVGSIGPTRGRCLAKLRSQLANDPAWQT